jgi:UDP-N-acetylglucosamine 2-epimerase
MRILIAFGTRPEIIKLAPVCRALSNQREVKLDVFWSGQHIGLADGLIDLFNIKVTHSGSEVVDTVGLAGKFGLVAQQIENVLRSARYDWLVVQGDTATAAAAAIAGFFNKVQVAHVEAGLRTGNMLSPWPEEFNRRAITLCANQHFAPTPRAAGNLFAEGIDSQAVHVVGNTVIDALLHVRSLVSQRGYVPREAAVQSLPRDKKLVLVTTHRRENFGERLRQILFALREIGTDGDKIVVLPVHLNPTVRREVLAILGRASGVYLLEPLQYPDFVYLLERAWVVVTDSGGIQEEAPTFGLPVIIARDTTERPEAVEAGFGRLVGSSYASIVAGVRAATSQAQRQVIAGKNPFGEGDAGRKIAAHLLGLKQRGQTYRPIEERMSA